MGILMTIFFLYVCTIGLKRPNGDVLCIPVITNKWKQVQLNKYVLSFYVK